MGWLRADFPGPLRIAMLSAREGADALRDRVDWALTQGHSSLGSEEHPPCLSPDTTLLHGEHPARELHGPWSLLAGFPIST